MRDRAWTPRTRAVSDAPSPPLANEVAACPPHHWLLDQGWQECCKCGERRRTDELPPIRRSGVITRLAADRRTGYIRDSHGRPYFFSEGGLDGQTFADLREGLSVEFERDPAAAAPGASRRAVKIRLLPPDAATAGGS